MNPCDKPPIWHAFDMLRAAGLEPRVEMLQSRIVSGESLIKKAAEGNLGPYQVYDFILAYLLKRVEA